ncbi:MAG TPA: plastocyanin/azurin family copper-binding protein [Pseudonocardiaceae bacterium]|jgi:plastocyanin|nr:plastocyanin/azurin family copper-binding protein [Pseudonocardiaceae bacterium]
MIARPTVRLALVFAVLAVLTPSVLLGVFAPPAAAAGHSVTMAHYQFSPTSLTITAGDTVTWTNTDQATHNVVTSSAPASISSGDITTGGSFSYRFTVPGTYSYVCTYHPGMDATITVQPAAASVPVPAPAPTSANRVAPTRTARPPSTGVPVTTVAPSTSAGAAPVATTAPPSTSASMDMGTATPQPAAANTASASASSSSALNPLLLVAGLVAAVATLCLLLIGSKPDTGS